ncbi:OB-fold domain-containing protein [Mycolicibacterium sphagni]|nr:OB-fold domain-containing protein [Mycolicibacterium sphagni]
MESIGTYLPTWHTQGDKGIRRVRGHDEDALTMAVAAGRAADPEGTAQRVVFVSRDFPLIEGGNAAVLLAGLSLGADLPVAEVLGNGPAVVDEILGARPGTLVIAADDSPTTVGAGAVLVGERGATLRFVARHTGSLPVIARRPDGTEHRYRDPRLQREVGIKSTLGRLALPTESVAVAVCGATQSDLGGTLTVRVATTERQPSAAGMVRALADAIEADREGLVIGLEQACVTVADLTRGAVRLCRDERPSIALPASRSAEGNGIPISLAAYARAFDPKLRWEAAVFDEQPGIDAQPQFPPRARVSSTGILATDYRCQALPRTGTVHSHTTIFLPVPDLHSPYSLALVALDDSPVRVLLKVTGVPAGKVRIGEAGSIVLRKIATRAGIPDYGHAFLPLCAVPAGALTERKVLA